MPDHEAIAAADYVIDGFVEADDELRRHRKTGGESAVRRAAAALCRALTRLETDEGFWDELEHALSRSRRTTLNTLGDLDDLISVERDVLVEAGVPQATVAEILREMVNSLEQFDRWPDEFAIGRLREAVGGAARAACMEATFRNVARPTKRLRRAVRVAAGGVIIVADAIVAPDEVRELSFIVGTHVVARSLQTGD